MKQLLQRLANRLGYQIIRNDARRLKRLPEYDGPFSRIYHLCQAYTCTSPERMLALYKSVQYITQNNIPGDIVECGVWRGGSMMLVAHALNAFDSQSRTLYLYDTFEGMPDPSDHDVDSNGDKLTETLRRIPKTAESVWCYVELSEVKQNLLSTGYPPDKIQFIKGKVEETIPRIIPDQIALLRLDTDWYESTLHELKYLYDRISPNGVLIIDDYGDWQGARRAVDEFFLHNGARPFMNIIDSTGRLIIKAPFARGD